MAKKRKKKGPQQAFLEVQHLNEGMGPPRQMLIISTDYFEAILEHFEDRWARGKTGGLSLGEAIARAVYARCQDMDDPRSQPPPALAGLDEVEEDGG